MKTTLMFRRMIANPRRTTLAHLKDVSEMGAVPVMAGSGTPAAQLPSRTANPRRTVLTELPVAETAS